ncbi:hypothetical protein FACS1894110_05080 [Spirochaetia bacterium]|nr:hypothetical protein FACS1894110_05080 [Spirochaetia bacterium]
MERGNAKPRQMVFKDNYFLRFFAFLFVIIFVLIGISVYTVFYIYNIRKTADAQAHITDYLNHTDKTMVSLISAIDILYTLTVSNEEVRHFLSPSAEPELPDVESRERLAAFLWGVCALNPYIESVGIYNYYSNEYLANGFSHPPDMKLFMRVFLGHLSAGVTRDLAKRRHFFLFRSGLPARGEEGPGDTLECISIVYSGADTSGKLSSAISINLNVQKISENIFTDPGGEEIILNEIGSVICVEPGVESIPLTDRAKWSRQTNNQARRSGWLPYNSQGKEKNVAFLRMSESGWTLYRISDPISFHPLYPGMRLYWLIILPAALVFSALAAAIVASRLYRPVEHRIIKLEKENTSYLSTARANYLNNILDEYSESSGNENDWSLYGIKVVPRQLLILIVKWDETEEAPLGDQAFELIVRHSAERCLGAFYCFEITSAKNGEVSILLNPLSKTGDSESDLLPHLERFRKFVPIQAGIQLSITIAVGGMALETRDCAACIHRARNLLRQRFVLGYGHIITAESVKTSLREDIEFPSQLMEKMEKDIHEISKSRFMQHYGSMVDYLHGYCYQAVAPVLLQVITRCLHTMNSVSLDNIPVTLEFYEFNLLFSSLHTLDHSHEWFDRTYDNFLAAVRKNELLRSKKHKHLVIQIQDYTAEHYGDLNFSVETLADHFGYTPNHLSKIFRSETHIYLRNYIKNVRIQHARDMLENTDLPIQEVSLKSGFPNYNYFFSLFRKENGLTPTVYRSRFMGN